MLTLLYYVGKPIHVVGFPAPLQSSNEPAMYEPAIFVKSRNKRSDRNTIRWLGRNLEG